MAGPTTPQQRRPPPLVSAAHSSERSGLRFGPSLAIGIGGVAVGLLVGLLVAFARPAPRPAIHAGAAEDRPWPPLEDGTRSEAYRRAAAGKDAPPRPARDGEDLPQNPAVGPGERVGKDADASAVKAELAEKQRLAEMARQREIVERQRKAFEDLDRLVKVVELPTASGGADIGGPAPTTNVAIIDLGPFAVGDLVDPRFRLAVPRDTINGKPFVATITAAEPGAGSEPKWVIQYQPQDESLDGKAQEPRTLATLVVRENQLVLEVRNSNVLAMRPFALLRRSVILVEARDPGDGDAAPIVKEIRLVKPVEVGPFAIDPLGERQLFTIVSPPGIRNHDTPPGQDQPIPYQLPVNGIEITADLMGTRVDVQLPRDAKEGKDPGIWERQVTLADLHPDPGMLSLVMDVKMTVREATLTVRPKFEGTKANLVTLDMVRRNFIEKPQEALERVLKAFDRRVRACPGHDFGKAKTPRGATTIEDWLAGPLATVQNMGMTLPGHETIAASFDLYVKERHAKDSEKPSKKPEDREEWRQRLEAINDPGEWKKQFSDQLGRWADWFRARFEKQWQEYANIFAGASKRTLLVRIEAINSLAYDEAGKEYRVPLTVYGDEFPATGHEANDLRDADQKSQQPGDTVPSPAGGGNRAGID